MATRFYDFPILTQNQASPGNLALQTALQNYMNIGKAAHAMPNAKEDLQEKILKNKFYGPNVESEIGLRGAQAGHLGSLTKGQNITNEFLPQQLQAAIQQAQAIASKRQAEQQILSRYLGGMNRGQQNPGNQEIPMTSQGQNQPFNGQLNPAMQTQPSQMGMPTQQIAPQQMPQQQMLSPEQQGLISKLLGFDINPGQTAKNKEIGKLDAQKISDLDNIVLKSSTKQDTFNALGQLLAKPAFEQMRQNPVLGRHELQFYEKFGTPEQKEAIGQFKAFTGQIIKDAAGDFKGQFRVGEQSLLNATKPSDSDTIEAMKGKTQALMFLVNSMAERARIESDAMRNSGLSPTQARILSDRLYDPKKISSEVSKMLHPIRHVEKDKLMKIAGGKL